MFAVKMGIPALIVFILIIALFVFAWAKIFSKAGHSPAFCILMCVPFVNLITFLWFAFSTWPIERRLGAGEQKL